MSMAKIITEQQLKDLINLRIDRIIRMEALQKEKKSLENLLENFDKEDFIWNAADSAKRDIEDEFGEDEYAEFGDTEDAGSFVRGLDQSSEKDAKMFAKGWMGKFSEPEPDHECMDSEIDSLMREKKSLEEELEDYDDIRTVDPYGSPDEVDMDSKHFGIQFPKKGEVMYKIVD
jgi:hypothetical protein